ncbi:MAG TPA: DUF1854 domain-containing protein [Anaerolineae bacterium]|nr:DUF1854 domain-containing protein [Anaerolineae bacterium]
MTTSATTAPKSFEILYLDPQTVHFARQGDTLTLTLADGARYPRVILRSCFPVSDNTTFLSVRDAEDEDNAEIGVIEDWGQLAPADREAVAAELGLHYFVPEITQVFSIREELGFLYWKVQTSKGDKEFVMRNSIIHYAREIAPGHWLLIDVNEARYEILDFNALDAHSQKLITEFLYL